MAYNSDVFYQKGLDSLKQRDYPNAINCFTEVLKIEKSSSGYSNRAFAYYNLGKKDLAKLDFERSIEEIKGILDKSKDKDPITYDKCLIEISRAVSSIAQINMDTKNFIEAENNYTQIMGLYKMINDEKLIPNDLHISHIYTNRGVVRYKLNQIDNAARDLAAAFLETNSNDTRKELADFAAMAGMTEKLELSITVYSTLRKKQ